MPFLLSLCLQITFLNLPSLTPDSFLSISLKTVFKTTLLSKLPSPFPFINYLGVKEKERKKKPLNQYVQHLLSHSWHPAVLLSSGHSQPLKCYMLQGFHSKHLRMLRVSVGSTCAAELKQHAEFGKKIAGPCNYRKKAVRVGESKPFMFDEEGRSI